MAIKKKLVVVFIVLVLLGTYIFVIKPNFFQGELSEEMITDANREFESVLESMSNDIDSDVSGEAPLEADNSIDNSEKNLNTLEQSPDQSISDLSEKGAVIQNKSSQEPNATETTSQNPKQETASTVVNNTAKANVVVLTDEQKIQKIEKKYQSGMKKLEDKAESLLAQLISEAKIEYSALSGEQRDSLVVTGQMASNYIARADALEKLVDKAVNELLASMKKELADESLSANSVEKFRKEYEKRKKDRQNELLTKALSYQP